MQFGWVMPGIYLLSIYMNQMLKLLILSLIAWKCWTTPDQCLLVNFLTADCQQCNPGYSIYTVGMNYCCYETCTACNISSADNCTDCPQGYYLEQKSASVIHCSECDFPNLPVKCVDCSTATNCSECESGY